MISQKNYRNIKVQKFVEDFSSFSRGEAVYKVHFGISDHLYSVIGEKIGVTGQCESGTVQIGFRDEFVLCMTFCCTWLKVELHSLPELADQIGKFDVFPFWYGFLIIYRHDGRPIFIQWNRNLNPGSGLLN